MELIYTPSMFILFFNLKPLFCSSSVLFWFLLYYFTLYMIKLLVMTVTWILVQQIFPPNPLFCVVSFQFCFSFVEFAFLLCYFEMTTDDTITVSSSENLCFMLWLIVAYQSTKTEQRKSLSAKLSFFSQTRLLKAADKYIGIYLPYLWNYPQTICICIKLADTLLQTKETCLQQNR